MYRGVIIRRWKTDSAIAKQMEAKPMNVELIRGLVEEKGAGDVARLTAVRLLAKRGVVEDAVRLWGRVDKGDGGNDVQKAGAGMLLMHGRNKNLAELRNTMQTLIRAAGAAGKIFPTTYAAYAQGLRMAGKPQEAKSTLKKMERSRVKPNTAMLNTLIACGGYHEGLGLMKKIPKPDEHSYNALLRVAAMESHGSSLCDTHLESMTRSKLMPTALHWDSCLLAYTRCSPESLQSYLTRRQAHGIPLTPTSYSHLIEHGGTIKESEAWYGAVPRPTHYHQLALLRRYGEGGESGKAQCFVESLRGREVHPEVAATYRKMIGGGDRERDYELI